MSEIIHTEGAKDIQIWTPPGEVEVQAIEQLKNVARLPWTFHHVAVMADCHYGKGATVGSVIAMKGAVSPAAVGVDIGCGMGAIKTSLRASDLPDNLEGLRAVIEAAIPVSFNAHEEPAFKGYMPEAIRRDGAQIFSEFRGLTEKVQDLLGKAKRQVGTLGGGNHFIEVCLDEGGEECAYPEDYPDCQTCSEPRVWLMLHSGSRNIGKVLAEHHISIAKKLAHNQELPDRDLSVFLAGTPEMAAYRNDLFWAQRYAFLNRRVMFELLKVAFCESIGLNYLDERTGLYRAQTVFGASGVQFGAPILCHHNYVSEERHFGEDLIVTRKGAISAKLNEYGIIPGSMGTKSYIVSGRGNPESFNSASHGAGRRMSRTKANKTFTLDDLAAQTAGVCCRKDGGVLDEIPGAYKDIEQVMANQADLVEVRHVLKQVLCVKG